MACNKDCNNRLFPNETVKAVWMKRGKRHSWGPNWGYDVYGNSIKLEDYGNLNSQWGWDIDHSKPKAAGGTDHLNNLQPMQTYHNRVIKADNYPWTEQQHWTRFRQLQKK